MQLALVTFNVEDYYNSSECFGWTDSLTTSHVVVMNDRCMPYGDYYLRLNVNKSLVYGFLLRCETKNKNWNHR